MSHASVHMYLREWDFHGDSPNRRRGAHWSQAARRARKAKNYVLAALSELRRSRGDTAREVHVPGSVELKFIYRLGPRQRALDQDNAVGACKPLIDALVHHGIIDGDTPDILPHPPHVLEVDAKTHGGDPRGLDIFIRPL